MHLNYEPLDVTEWWNQRDEIQRMKIQKIFETTATNVKIEELCLFQLFFQLPLFNWIYSNCVGNGNADNDDTFYVHIPLSFHSSRWIKLEWNKRLFKHAHIRNRAFTFTFTYIPNPNSIHIHMHTPFKMLKIHPKNQILWGLYFGEQNVHC